LLFFDGGAAMADVIDEKVDIVDRGLEVGDVVMLTDVKIYLQTSKFSYTEDDLQIAFARLRSKGIIIEDLGSSARTRLRKP